MNTLTLDDISSEIRANVTLQSSHNEQIEGVQILPITTHVTEDGSFTELMRLNEQGNLEMKSDFHVAQINKSIMLPNTIKAWHLHYNQDEIWNVGARTHILLGLWDVREHSSTKGASMRIPLSRDRLVYIPRGVAHGAANHLTHAIELFYFVNNQYDKDHLDEQRLSWDSLGKEFWAYKNE